MTMQGQLAQSALSPHGQSLAPLALQSSTLYANAGLLGNAAIQIRVPAPDVDSVIQMYRRLSSGARPAVRLAILKRQKFSPAGKQARVQSSLVALNAPQPTELSLAQWKEILEEIEDED